ncbi:N-acetylneuraminate synthase family protein [Wukongibacter sp. M2B1]|uniref:N-acetylneuraminate synthase family protein n=1 Tax=Wukongibacter sp. M2B1 TaxID=3088895 RepID=UPI003D7A5D66
MPKNINIGNKIIGDNQPCFIIAEAGSNHDGKYEQAIKLIDLAVEANADAVKFQIFTAGKIAAKTNHEIAKLNSTHGQDLYELYKKLEIPRQWIPKLKKYCDEKEIMFLATPFDYDAVDSLEEIDIAAYKIASFELVHLPLLRYVARTGKPIIFSTGMANMSEIETAIDTITQEGNKDIIVLHCGISYPMPFDEVNIKAMNSIKSAFDVNVGYSDHTSGIVVPTVAVSLGAKAIEKHYTINKCLSGPDHEFALGPDELIEMVKSIRIAESIMGDGIKKPTESEMIHRKRGRRSIFINKNLKKGHVLTLEDIEVLRPGVGIETKHLNLVIGRELKYDVNKYDPLTWELI